MDASDPFFQHTNLWNNILFSFGLSPLAARKSEKNSEFKVSSYRRIYCLALAVLFCSLFLVQKLLFLQPLAIGVTLPITNNFLLVAENVSISILIVSAVQNGRGHSLVLRELFECETLFKKPGNNAIKRLSTRLFTVCFVVFSASFIHDMVTKCEVNSFAWQAIMKTVLGYIFLLYNVVVVSQIAINQFWLRISLSRINEDLASLLETATEKENCFIFERRKLSEGPYHINSGSSSFKSEPSCSSLIVSKKVYYLFICLFKCLYLKNHTKQYFV